MKTRRSSFFFLWASWATSTAQTTADDSLGGFVRVIPPVEDSWELGHDLPDVVNGSLFSRHIFLRLQSRPSAPPLRRLRLHVEGSDHLAPSASPLPRTLEPGQPTSLHAPLLQRSATVHPSSCPLPVTLVVRAAVAAAAEGGVSEGGEGSAETEAGKEGERDVVVATHRVRLQCRTIDDRFTFVYLDFDGSPQIAAAKFPLVLERKKRRKRRKKKKKKPPDDP